jgi:hypothetical protein
MKRIGLHRSVIGIGIGIVLAAASGWAANGPCTQSAAKLQTACGNNVNEEYRVTLAACLNMTDDAVRAQCIADAQAARDDGNSSCTDVNAARLKVCGAIGDAAYEPKFGADFADQFVDPRDIGRTVRANPYFPLLPGSEWKYRTTFKDEDGETVTERDTVTVTSGTKLIEGITCVIVTDVVTSTDGSVESTQDWFAQDVGGNVWYCGEIAQQKETFDGDEPATPELVGIDGSWKAGRNFAKPGIQMFATPQKGKTYRQELLWTEAEDVAQVLNLNAVESVSGGAFRCNGRCIETHDYSALEPDAAENKFYAPGVGLILEVDLGNGNARNELVSYKHP